MYWCFQPNNVLTRFTSAGAFKDLVLVDNATLVCLLPAGRTQLSIDSELEGPECGLVPIGMCLNIRLSLNLTSVRLQVVLVEVPPQPGCAGS